MLTVKMYCDKIVGYRNETIVQQFKDAAEFQDWIFAQYGVYKCDKRTGFESNFSMTPAGHYWVYIRIIDPVIIGYTVKMISDERGVLYSDGTYTYDKKHIAKEMIAFFASCEERLKTEQQFTFIA